MITLTLANYKNRQQELIREAESYRLLKSLQKAKSPAARGLARLLSLI